MDGGILMTKDVGKKPRYQAPVMMPLDAVKSAAGLCELGSGDSELCTIGYNAYPTCDPGGAANPECIGGSLPAEA